MTRNKMKNVCSKAVSVFLMLFLLLLPVCSVSAASERFLESYESEEGKVKVYCSNLGDGASLSPEQFAVTLSSKEMPVSEITTAEQEKTPMTFYCLTDVSGSMKPEQMDQAKQALTSICDSLGADDNMVVGSLGNNLTSSDFLSDKNAIHAEIDALQAGNEDTNLYQGIVNSITVLKEDSRVNRKKCLLILSDGEDDQKSGITKSEAEQAVHNSAIPVYTVATLRESQTDEQIESSKLLGSFARISAGGVDYAPIIDGTDAAAVGQEIVANMKGGAILSIDTSTAEAGKDVLLLRVSYTDAGQSVREDTMEIFAEDLKLAQASDQEQAQEDSDKDDTKDAGKEDGKEDSDKEDGKEDSEKGDEEDSEKEDDAEDSEETEEESFFSKYKYVIIGGGIAAVVLVIIIVLLLLKKKKNRAKEEDDAQEPEETIDEAEIWSQAQNIWPEEQTVYPADRGQQVTVEINHIDYELRFTAIGDANISYTLQVPEGKVMTLGRDNRADLILNPEDRRLSGVHCKIRCKDNVMNIWDNNSKNGTFVNGVPIMQMGLATVRNGQSVRLGSYEYRVTIKHFN